MGKLDKWKRVISLIICAALIVISTTGCSKNLKANNSQQNKNNPSQPSKLAIQVGSIANNLLSTMNFPIYLPSYFPNMGQTYEWHLVPKIDNNQFSIEIYNWIPGHTNGNGTEYGTLCGNIGNSHPLYDHRLNSESESKEVKTISLPNGIEGKEQVYPTLLEYTLSWKIGQWSYFIESQPGNEDKIIKYASQIINTIGSNGQVLNAFPGKFIFYQSNDRPFTEIFWNVNDSICYQLDWRDPIDAIKILRSMELKGVH